MAHVLIEEVIDICKRQGRSFGASAEVELTASGSLKTIFKTGSRPVVLYSRLISYDGDGVNAYIYRLPTWDNQTGTPIESYSSNDIIQLEAESGVIGGATITNDGILTRPIVYAFANTSNQGNGALLQAIDEPLKMPPNYEYCLVIENRDTANPQTVAASILFAEADNIPSISIEGTEGAYAGRGLDV